MKLCTLLLALFCAARIDGQTLPPPVPQLPPADRILVMPFDNPSGEGRVYWLREAASVLMAEDLGAAGASVIDREQRLRAFERLGVPSHASLSDATVIKIGQLLGASTVVVGALTISGNDLEVRAHSIRLESGRMQAEITERAPLTSLFRTFDRVATRLFPLLSLPTGHGEKDHPPLPAFENYIKGLVSETGAVQVKFLQAAISAYSRYDAARLALWQVYNVQGEHARALAAALDVPENSLLYRRARFLAALSHIQLKQYDQAFGLLRGLNERQPAAAIANNMGVVQMRRGSSQPAGSATYFFNKARDLDPAEPDYAFNLGYAYLLDREFLAAAYWLREAVRRDPADGDGHYLLGVALTATGASTEGGREKELARRLSSTYSEWDRRPVSDPVPRGRERLQEDLEKAARPDAEFAFEATGQKDQRDLARFHLEQGRRLFQHENDREALEELRKSIYLAPYQAEAHLLLGRIKLRNGRVTEAIGDLKISLWSQETVAAHLALAEAYLQAKDAASARAEVQRALALDPRSSDAKKLLDRIGFAR